MGNLYYDSSVVYDGTSWANNQFRTVEFGESAKIREDAYAWLLSNASQFQMITKQYLEGTMTSLVDNDITSIGSSTFVYYYGLKTVSLPNCTYIGSEAFRYCGINYLSLPNCQSMDSYAFLGCSGITSVDLPKCTSLNYAFIQCSNLTSANLPVCSYLSGTFRSCSKLTTVNLPNCTNIANSTFENCSNLMSIDLPLCSNIGWGAFAVCTGLNSISIPNCTTIGSYAFRTCTSLVVLNLPSCRYIYNYAFSYCTNLSEIHIGTSNCSLSASLAFSSTGIGQTKGSIFVPSSCLSYYKASTNWTYFSNRIFPEYVLATYVDADGTVLGTEEVRCGQTPNGYVSEYMEGSSYEPEMSQIIQDTTFTVTDYSYLSKGV